MLFTKTEIDAMDDLRCYESKEDLVRNEIDDDEKDMYIQSDYNWDTSLNEWFLDNLKQRIFEVEINKDQILYVFDNVGDDIDCNIEELINKIFDNYDIQDQSSFEEVIVDIQDRFYQKKLSYEEKELLKNVHVYDDLYDLAEEYYTEEDLEEYISHFGNLEYKFEDWFFDDTTKCYECNGLYLYIDSNDMFIPEKKRKMQKQIDEIFDKYTIYTIDTIVDLKKQNHIGDDESCVEK